MRVILLEDIKNLGKKYEVKDVADGYARNFLIPHHLVRLATPMALKELTLQKGRFKTEDLEIKKHLAKLAERLNDRYLKFFLKTNEEGIVFGSVTKEMILKALRENDLVTKERVQIKIDQPLKKLGEHQIEVDLKKGIKAKIKVILQSQP